MQRSRYTHIVKQVFPYSQESTTGSLPFIISEQTYLSLVWTYLSLVDNLPINIQYKKLNGNERKDDKQYLKVTVW